MNHEANDHARREARVNAAIADFLKAVDSGQTPDRAAFLRQHADLTPELEAFLSDQARLGALFPPTPGGSLASTGPDLPPCQPATTPEGGVATAAKAPPGWAGRLHLVEPIGQGGMGEVYRVRDSDFGRDLAVKILKTNLLDNSAMVERFLEEARVCGRLQHPGVPPVHEMGRLPNGRPYFTMKLVRGRTLADSLRERGDVGQVSNLPGSAQASWKLAPRADLPRFLKIFEQIGQTVAYAHSQGIIHRDLKPANVMVGAFGEVQVMDWGLAKQLASEPPPSEPRPSGSGPDEVGSLTVGALKDKGQTHPGDVLGTFAYMPPEQARGEIDRLDEHCDVFSLGALLCQVLTGRPPYTGTDKASLWEKAQCADLAEAFAGLDGCGADAELTGLAKRCLSAEPADRPQHAGEVAQAVAAYLAAVEERARQAEVERAAAEARAAEAKAKARAERRSRRLAVGLAAAVLLTVLAGGGVWLWLVQDRAARERSANVALGKAEQLMDQAEEVDPATVADAERAVVLWRQAADLLDQAEGVLASGFGAEAARERLADQRRGVETGLRRAESVAKLLVGLDKARARRSNWRGNNFDYESAAKAYRDAVAEYGLDVLGSEPEAVAAAIRKERPAMRLALTVALDDWSVCARDKVRTPRLLQVADLADDDGWRQRCRAAVASRDLGELKRLARDARGQVLPALCTELLAASLRLGGARTEAAALLRHARGQHPTDFWIHFELGNCLYDPAHHPDPATLDEALGCFWAAVALRPGNSAAQTNLGSALADKGLLDEAIACYRTAVEIDPSNSTAYNNLGNALHDKGLVDEAIACYGKAIAIDPRYALPHLNLGLALKAKGLVDEAIACYGKAIAIDPRYAPPHLNLGFALFGIGQVDRAIECYLKAIEIDPTDARVHINLGDALEAKGQVDEAIAAFHKAIGIDPKNARAHGGLGNALAEKGLLEEAIACYRNAIKIDPKLALAHYSLGNALLAKGQGAESVAEFRKAIDIDPKFAPAHGALGLALLRQGRFGEARDATHRALDLLPERDPLRARVTRQFHQCERLLVLDEKLPAILKGEAQPADNQERLQLAYLCYEHKKRHVAAVGFFSDTFAAEPELADDLNAQHRYNAACAAALAGTGQGEDAAKLDAKVRARLRQQALTWLRADLTAWGKLLENQPDKGRSGTDFKSVLQKTMQRWQQDADFARVRGDALAKLPETERKEWQKLWDDLETLRQRAAPQPELVPPPRKEEP
jgi:serine/threonine-protein kinase